jgi:hypothetical protein
MFAGVLWLASGSSVRGQAADHDKSKDESKAVMALVEQSVDRYRIFTDVNAREATPAQRVLRWRNVTRGTQVSEGVLVIWAHHGRPEASLGVYPYDGNLVFDFVSLSRGSKLVGRDEGRVFWSPEAPGVEFKDLPDAPAPANSAAGRLRQMRTLADRFRVTMTGWKPDKSDREELRLLAKPLFRDETRAAQPRDTDWIDGGVFAFVQGTDPEAILLLEAVHQNGRARWQYAFARATAAGLEARLDKTVVWEVGFLVGNATPLMPQTTLRHPLEAAASGGSAASANR